MRYRACREPRAAGPGGAAGRGGSAPGQRTAHLLHRGTAGHRRKGEQGSGARRPGRIPVSNCLPDASRSTSRPPKFPRKVAVRPAHRAGILLASAQLDVAASGEQRASSTANSGSPVSSSPSRACCSPPRMRRASARTGRAHRQSCRRRLAAWTVARVPPPARGLRALNSMQGTARSATIGAQRRGQVAAGLRTARRWNWPMSAARRQAKRALLDCRRRRTQPLVGRSTGHGQEHARAAPARPAAAARQRGSAGRRGHRVREQPGHRRRANTGGDLPRPTSHALRPAPSSEADRTARPGEVSLAHRGVLFLDELPEFNRRVLESLREPMETGAISDSARQAAGGISGALPARGRDESLPVRVSRRPLRQSRCAPPGNRALPRTCLPARCWIVLDLRVEVPGGAGASVGEGAVASGRGWGSAVAAEQVCAARAPAAAAARGAS